MSGPYRPLDLSAVRTYPLATRPSKVRTEDFGWPHRAGGSFATFYRGLPDTLAAHALRHVAGAMAAAYRAGKPILWGMGAHVIKCGLTPFLLDALDRRLITALALNGAGIIHDVELALAGHTSEDVAEGLAAGRFGMVTETGSFINEAIGRGAKEGLGLGEVIGRSLLETNPPNLDYSLLFRAYRLGVPVTVHVAIGSDIVHMHPGADGAALGQTSFHDFRLLAAIVADLGDGGIYLNVGSAVILPEVFLKALTVARNLGYPVHNFTTVNLDMLQHYRPLQNVVSRPTQNPPGGHGYTITGHHEIMVPLLLAAVAEELGGA